jgi:regulatory protein
VADHPDDLSSRLGSGRSRLDLGLDPDADQASELRAGRVSQSIDQGLVESPEAAAERAFRATLERGMRALAIREHGRSELVLKLTGKGISRELAARAVDHLAEQGLQSDERFAESYTHSRIERGYGPVYIAQALRQKGIDSDTVTDHLGQGSSFWIERAQLARARKFGPEIPSVRAEWQRQARFLAQRGFGADLVMRVLDPRD